MKIKSILNVAAVVCLRSDLITASINCWPGVAFVFVFCWGKNSLASYLLLIHTSFSSLDEVDLGLTRCRVLASQTELAKLLPMASMTLK